MNSPTMPSSFLPSEARFATRSRTQCDRVYCKRAVAEPCIAAQALRCTVGRWRAAGCCPQTWHALIIIVNTLKLAHTRCASSRQKKHDATCPLNSSQNEGNGASALARKQSLRANHPPSSSGCFDAGAVAKGSPGLGEFSATIRLVGTRRTNRVNRQQHILRNDVGSSSGRRTRARSGESLPLRRADIVWPLFRSCDPSPGRSLGRFGARTAQRCARVTQLFAIVSLDSFVARVPVSATRTTSTCPSRCSHQRCR